jgi:hypothetical protein
LVLIPAEAKMSELTFKVIFRGAVMAVVLGAANAYLGMKVGLTVAATIPASAVPPPVSCLPAGPPRDSRRRGTDRGCDAGPIQPTGVYVSGVGTVNLNVGHTPLSPP